MEPDNQSSPSWELLEAVNVNNDRKIRLPSNVYELVHSDDQPLNEVAWQYHKNFGFIIVSEVGTRLSPYARVKTSQIYDKDGGYEIRIPDNKFPDWVRSKIQLEEAYFFAHDDMISGEIKSVYLLWDAEVRQLLPGSDFDEDLAEALLHTPGFHSE